MNLFDKVNPIFNIDEEMSEGAKNTLSGIAEMLNVKAYLISNSTNGNN